MRAYIVILIPMCVAVAAVYKERFLAKLYVLHVYIRTLIACNNYICTTCCIYPGDQLLMCVKYVSLLLVCCICIYVQCISKSLHLSLSQIGQLLS